MTDLPATLEASDSQPVALADRGTARLVIGAVAAVVCLAIVASVVLTMADKGDVGDYLTLAGTGLGSLATLATTRIWQTRTETAA